MLGFEARSGNSVGVRKVKHLPFLVWPSWGRKHSHIRRRPRFS